LRGGAARYNLFHSRGLAAGFADEPQQFDALPDEK
jgi:hypothetical protein